MIRDSYHLTFLIFVPMFMALLGNANTASAYACNKLGPSVAIPSGFGASFNLFSTAKELLISGNCQDTTSVTVGTVTVGNGNPATYAYNRGYHWNGSSWTPFTLSCSGQSVSGVWCVGSGSASINLTQDLTEVIGYTCQWNGTRWNCGCRDSSCATAYWQLQRLEKANIPPSGTRDVFFTGTLSTSTVKKPGQTVDSWLVRTLPIAQVGDDNFTNISATTCCAAGSGLDSRVVSSITVGGEVITPRAGPFFYMHELHHDKEYSCLSGTCGVAPSKPRSKLALGQSIHKFDSMVEHWWGFSLRIPQNFQHERAKGQHGNGPILFGVNNNSSEGILQIRAMIKGPKEYPTADSGGDMCGNNSACLQNNNTRLWVNWPVKTTLGEPSPQGHNWRNLGDINACKGKWIDIVVRLVNNPFSSTTDGGNISGAADITYVTNKGLLEVWASDCADAPDASGYRVMVKRASVCNAPMGLVQRSGADQKWDAGWSPYAYGWQPGEPTTRTHSIWYGYDEMFTGQTVRDGTGYADVNPSGKAPESGQEPCSYVPYR